MYLTCYPFTVDRYVLHDRYLYTPSDNYYTDWEAKKKMFQGPISLYNVHFESDGLRVL